MPSSLPPELLALVEMSPIEDLLLAILPPQMPGIHVKSLIEDDQTFPLVLIRRNGDWGTWSGDDRFVDTGQITIHTYCEGLNADMDSALLAEIVRVLLRDAVNVVVPNRGHITQVRMVSSPRRVADWATATGPVQFADLPSGVIRYETVYDIDVKRSLIGPYPV